MKDQKGEPVFSGNFDELLAGKIIRHSRQAGDVRDEDSRLTPRFRHKIHPHLSNPFGSTKKIVTIFDILLIISALGLLTVLSQILSGKRRWVFFFDASRR